MERPLRNLGSESSLDLPPLPPPKPKPLKPPPEARKPSDILEISATDNRLGDGNVCCKYCSDLTRGYWRKVQGRWHLYSCVETKPGGVRVLLKHKCKKIPNSDDPRNAEKVALPEVLKDSLEAMIGENPTDAERAEGARELLRMINDGEISVSEVIEGYTDKTSRNGYQLAEPEGPEDFSSVY